jgi:hypothetical protein
MSLGVVVVLGAAAARCPSIGEELNVVASRASREELVDALREYALPQGKRKSMS